MRLKIGLLLLVCSFLRVSGQERSKGLKVGDQVPEVSGTVRLGDYKGKLLLIDFWATWCSPCVAMIPTMEALQAEFGDRVQFLPVAYQSKGEVAAFLSKLEQGKKSLLPEVTGDVALGKLFPHTYLPHYVWIGPDGKVLAITGYEEVTREKISAALAGSVIGLGLKRDTSVAYNAGKPLLLGGNGGDGSGLVYHALFTGFIEGLPAGYTIGPKEGPGGRRITGRNLAVPDLYALAFCEDKRVLGRNRVVLEVKDTSALRSRLHGNAYHEWMSRQHVFCYELSVPPELSGDLYRLMQADLVRLLPGYTAALEVRPTRCWVLERTTAEDKLKSRGGEPLVSLEVLGGEMRNTYLGQLVSRLAVIYWQNRLPVIDETGYTGPVDMSINARLTDVQAVNGEVERYGLKFMERLRPLEVLVIKDKIQN